MAKDSPNRSDHPLGTHPVSTAVGGVAGAVAAGATAGVAAGPIGAAAGVVVGAGLGSVSGKLIADLADPQMERKFWEGTALHERDHPEETLEAFQWARDLAEPDPDTDEPPKDA